jgi:hypothetical protein
MKRIVIVFLLLAYYHINAQQKIFLAKGLDTVTAPVKDSTFKISFTLTGVEIGKTSKVLITGLNTNSALNKIDYALQNADSDLVDTVIINAKASSGNFNVFIKGYSTQEYKTIILHALIIAAKGDTDKRAFIIIVAPQKIKENKKESVNNTPEAEVDFLKFNMCDKDLNVQLYQNLNGKTDKVQKNGLVNIGSIIINKISVNADQEVKAEVIVNVFHNSIPEKYYTNENISMASGKSIPDSLYKDGISNNSFIFLKDILECGFKPASDSKNKANARNITSVTLSPQACTIEIVAPTPKTN